jgi:para-nitrobenzyl esterase
VEFLGVPYAQQPIGSLRFLPPQPLSPWHGTLEATRAGPYCAQPLMPYAAQIDEACLQLNIFAPCTNTTSPQPFSQSDRNANAKLLPVMAWIHGGGFSIGSAVEKMYNGSSLASGGVVIVTINYRLGFLGFSSLGDAATDTSLGLLDQQLALRWVQKNIAAFGGDPQKVRGGGCWLVCCCCCCCCYCC